MRTLPDSDGLSWSWGTLWMGTNPQTSVSLPATSTSGSPLGQALLASTGDTRWWLAGTIKRDEWNGGNAAEMHLEDAALA